MKQNDFDPFSDLLITVYEYYGRRLAPATIQLYWNALSMFDFDLVKRLFTDHIQTHKFIPTISELLDVLRMMDGRPSAEEAWSMVARSLNDEGLTIVWTEETACSFGVALGLQNDRIAARMAFKESYEKLVQDARKQGKTAKWTPSLGHDAGGREGPLIEAVKIGRLPFHQVRALLPHRELNHDVLMLLKDDLGKKVIAA